MRWILGFFVLLAVALVGVYFYAVDLPYKKYVGWVSGNVRDSYFEIPNYKKMFLVPTPLGEIPPYQEDYVQLWREFPVGNTLIPLPTRHPFYEVLPIIEQKGKPTTPQLGVILQDPAGREISRIYTLPNRLYQDHSQGQELFKLPFVRKKILDKNLDELWKDIFTYQIEIKDKPIAQMIYDLYILHLRSKILPEETLRYGIINENQAMIELSPQDKDYRVELVLNQTSGSIFSYIVKTEVNKAESTKLRAKYLQSISFTPIDESVGKMLYTEFKGLNYARQVDQEGMLYLFSAWSQNTDNVEMLKEIINYLERGQNNKAQLNTMYKYAYKRYAKTFTNRSDLEGLDDPELNLQRKIEIESRDKRRAAEASSTKLPEVQELTPDEKMNLYLKQAKEKEKKSKSGEELTVH